MSIEEFQTSDVKSCSGDTDLAAAAKIMWDCDCGAVPIVDDERRVIGHDHRPRYLYRDGHSLGDSI